MSAKSTKRIIGLATTLIVLLLAVALVVTPMILNVNGSERYFSGEAEAYCQSLIEKGFPHDYAVCLTELHMLHPTWEFTPLLITDTNALYTWDYVIDRETEKGETNVVPSGLEYAAYQHPFNLTVYDSGYYQASRETVEYFMDPRNFLNETDIFQFYTLTGRDGKSVDTADAVKSLLKGTFMEDTVLENGISYADYFVRVGTELGIDPIFLAAKVRQEQGSGGTSPLISGNCGTKLWEFYRDQTSKTDSGQIVNPPLSGHSKDELLTLNGYYNYFNVGATGKGVFQIYYNAMQYAIKGTADMKNAWGGNSAWNTRWKAIYGGAYFIKTGYIDSYQSCVYLQKFNVDGRASTNFSKQYMTAVFGALSESRTLFQSFAAIDALDTPIGFLIPVYEGMPTSPCKDPALGHVDSFAQATNKYTDKADLISPVRLSAKNEAIYTTVEVYPDSTLKLTGSFVRNAKNKELTIKTNCIEYAWDGGEWQTASDGSDMQISLLMNVPESTEHILTVRGKVSYRVTKNGSSQTITSYALIAVVYVKVLPKTGVTLCYEVGNSITERKLYAGSTVTLPICEASDFAGWYGSDGSFLPSGADIVIDSDMTYSAIFLELKPLSGASLNLLGDQTRLCFSAVLDHNAYQTLNTEGAEHLSFSATLISGNHEETCILSSTNVITSANGRQWLRLTLTTPPLPESELDAAFSASFLASIRYTNGDTAVISTKGLGDVRTAKTIAIAALTDSSTAYPESLRRRFETIVEAE